MLHQFILNDLLSFIKSTLCYFVVENRSVESDRYPSHKSGRILCIILTINSTIYDRAPAIMKTWGSKCDEVLFSSNVDSTKFQTVTVGISSSSKKMVTLRLFRTLRYIYFKYRDEYDWFFVADDDTYVIVENLRHLLVDYDIANPHYLGFPYPTQLKLHGRKVRFAHGGSGYALNRRALEKLVIDGIPSDTEGVCVPWVTARRHDEHADYNVGLCLHKLGILAEDTKDLMGRQRFFKENPISLLNGVKNRKELLWFGFRDIIRAKAVGSIYSFTFFLFLLLVSD